MSHDWILGSTIPPHLWSPQYGSHGLVHNWIYFSIQDDVFTVPTSVTSAIVNKALDAALDDKDIQESLTPVNTASNPLQLQRYAMNERENKRHGRHSKTSGSDPEGSIYRGVIKKGKGFTGKDCPYRGVHRIIEGRKWETWLGDQDSGLPRIFLGTYYSAEDAARAYDIALIKFKGMDAITNFDLSTYEVEGIMKATKSPTAKTVATMNQVLLQRGSSEVSSSSFLLQQPLTHQPSSSLHGYQKNPNLMQSSPYSYGGYTGTGSGIGTSNNLAGNYYGSTIFPNKGANVEQPLINHQQSNSSSSFHGYTNYPNPIKNNPYSFSGLTGTGSMVGTNNKNPVGYYTAMLQGIGQDFQAPEAQKNQLNANNINNGGTSLGLHSEGFYQVQPYNQNFEAAQQVPIPNNQSNFLNHVPNQNSNSSFFSNFLNICSGTNTGSLSQMMESLDDSDLIQYANNSDGVFQKPYSETKTGSQSGQIPKGQYVMNNSDGSFQNPSSQTNTDSQSLMMVNESQVGLDSSQYLNISHDSSYIPCSEAKATGFQNLMTGNQDDLDMSKYLSGSYIMEGTDWFGDLDNFWAANVDNDL